MITLTVAQLQVIIYNGMCQAVEKQLKSQESTPPYVELNIDAAKLALAADSSPIDLERIASVL